MVQGSPQLRFPARISKLPCVMEATVFYLPSSTSAHTTIQIHVGDPNGENNARYWGSSSRVDCP